MIRALLVVTMMFVFTPVQSSSDACVLRRAFQNRPRILRRVIQNRPHILRRCHRF